ncbi:MAG TPA: winged helix-turn-helix domain-containing protein [Terriglobia bacterium]|nr:winged helix-turn-helix domain-containing protein [Terriglobia bacterium]
MREDDAHHSRKVRFYPYELDLSTGELCKNGLRTRLQQQPFQILIALLAKPGETISREELRELIWPGNVFLDYEHSLNRSINKLRHALADTAGKPRYIETLHGRGYRFIGVVDDGSAPREARLAVLPVENLTGAPENGGLADVLTEALIDELGRALRQRVRVVSLASVARYRNRRTPVEKIAAELEADYLACGRLRSEEGQFRLRVELVDARKHALRWSESFEFPHSGPATARKELCGRIASGIELELLPLKELLPALE